MIYLISIINYLYIIQTDKYVPITEKKKKRNGTNLTTRISK